MLETLVVVVTFPMPEHLFPTLVGLELGIHEVAPGGLHLCQVSPNGGWTKVDIVV